MKAVQELVAYFDKRGQLSRRQLKRLLEQNFVARTRRAACTASARRRA